MAMLRNKHRRDYSKSKVGRFLRHSVEVLDLQHMLTILQHTHL